MTHDDGSAQAKHPEYEEAGPDELDSVPVYELERGRRDLSPAARPVGPGQPARDAGTHPVYEREAQAVSCVIEWDDGRSAGSRYSGGDSSGQDVAIPIPPVYGRHVGDCETERLRISTDDDREPGPADEEFERLELEDVAPPVPISSAGRERMRKVAWL